MDEDNSQNTTGICYLGTVYLMLCTQAIYNFNINIEVIEIIIIIGWDIRYYALWLMILEELCLIC